MAGMAPWKPHEIADLTPIQLACMASEHPPGRRRARTAEDFRAIRESMLPPEG